MAPRPRPRLTPVETPAESASCTNCNEDPLANALREMAAAIREGTERFGPAADAIANLGTAQEKLCAFLVNNRVKIIGGLLAALTAIGAISPNAAGILGKLLAAGGV